MSKSFFRQDLGYYASHALEVFRALVRQTGCGHFVATCAMEGVKLGPGHARFTFYKSKTDTSLEISAVITLIKEGGMNGMFTFQSYPDCSQGKWRQQNGEIEIVEIGKIGTYEELEALGILQPPGSFTESASRPKTTKEQLVNTATVFRMKSFTAPDGTKFGDPIPGSNFFRAFCRICDEPIRVCREDINDIHALYCGCSSKPPARGTGLTPSQRQGLKHTNS